MYVFSLRGNTVGVSNFLLRNFPNCGNESGPLVHRHEPRNHLVLHSLALGTRRYWAAEPHVYYASAHHIPFQEGTHLGLRSMFIDFKC